MTPEDKAREIVDKKLRESGWQVQDYKDRDITLPGTAVREFPTKDRRAVDYALFVKGVLVGAVEAKKLGMLLTGVESQSNKYKKDLFEYYEPVFFYQSNGNQTSFYDIRDPDYRSRGVLTFHKPTHLLAMYNRPDTLRSRLKHIMPEIVGELRQCQKDSIVGLEKSLHNNRPRALVHMTMGAGKTRTAVVESYRLLKFADAKRILFIVDRAELGRQAYADYKDYMVFEENKMFTDLYNVQHLTSSCIEETSSVVISTIQRLYSILSKREYPGEEDEKSAFDRDEDDLEVMVEYNNGMPIDMFDFIVIDEAHRSIYNKWRQVLEYFDAFMVGLTATPYEHTRAFFKNNIVSSYSMQSSVLDNINVDFDCSKILTRANTDGVFIEEGDSIMLLDRSTGERHSTTAKKEQMYKPIELDVKIEAEDHIRTIITAFKKIQKDYFKRPEYVPKTLVFTKNERHADTVTNIIRDVFDKGNEFCKKITYTTPAANDVIRDFKNDVNFRITVSVDMLATGFDMKALECLLFMRKIDSPTYAEQMVGRGCRTIDKDLLRTITPDAVEKDSYLIVDAVGTLDVLNSKKFSVPPIYKNYKNLDKLMNKVADNRASRADIEALASRINKLAKRMNTQAKDLVKDATGGKTVEELAQLIREKINPETHKKEAERQFGENPTQEQIRQIKKEMLLEASRPFCNPKLRHAILDAAKRDDLIITQKQDELIGVMPIDITKRRESFGEFIKEYRDEFIALQILYDTPYRLHNLTYQHLKELAEAVRQPPYSLTPKKLWEAYEKLDRAGVKDNPRTMITDLISLVRFASGQQDMLVPYQDFVMKKFEKWLETQKTSGALLTSEHETWLRKIAEQISASCNVTKNDIQSTFHDKGGLIKFYKLFPNGDQMLVQIHEELTNNE